MFARHFHRPLESFSEAFVATTPADVNTTSGAALAEPDAFAAVVNRFSADRGCRDVRAAASQWSKWFFSRLIISTTVVQLAADRRLVCNWNDLTIGWHADGTPRCFVVTDDYFADGRGADLGALIDDLLCPLVEALTGYCRLSARVFWSNASVYYAWVLGELARQDRVAPDRIAAAQTLLHTRGRSDGGLNPFNGAYRRCKAGALDGNDEPVSHCRRLCCMRDLDAQWGLCANCPRVVHFDHARRSAAGH